MQVLKGQKADYVIFEPRRHWLNLILSVEDKQMVNKHLQGWVAKIETENLEVHYEGSKQQGFE